MGETLDDSTTGRHPPHGELEALPRITVGITCFNAAATIERALDSGLCQDWPNLEVIVVDDGSTDASTTILARRAATEPRLRVIAHGKNRGCAAARNTLVAAAAGEFLAFFDDDDVSRADRVRLQHRRITVYEHDAGTQTLACFASGQRIYPNGYVVPIRAPGVDGLPPVGQVMADYLLANQQRDGVFYGAGTPACSLMARTGVFRDLGGFDTAMRRQEDVDFAVRLAFNGGHFIGIAEPVLAQYATGGSEKGARVEFESFLHLLEKNADYLRTQGIYRYMRWWSEMRYRHFAGQDVRAALVLLRLLLAHPLRTAVHFAASATRRFRHERRMRAVPRG
jgi:glycosyltransferase involved in cell wall biosynthesis